MIKALLVLLTIGVPAAAQAAQLQAVTVATTGNVPGVIATQTNQLVVACTYAGEANPVPCIDPDSLAANAATFSVDSTAATVNGDGVLTGVSTGTVHVTATVGGVASPPLPLVVLSIPPGTYVLEYQNVVIGTFTIP